MIQLDPHNILEVINALKEAEKMIEEGNTGRAAILVRAASHVLSLGIPDDIS